MLAYVHHRIARFGQNLTQRLEQRFIAATKPAAPVVLAGTLADLTRSKPALVAENALLRQQLLILRRSVKRPRCTTADRTLLVLSGQSGLRVAAGVTHRPTRDPAALAPAGLPPLLATTVTGHNGTHAQSRSGNDRVDPRDGRG